MHIFQVFEEDSATDTVEWVAMDNAAWSAFVPYYPMLTTDTYAGYQLSTLPAEFVEEEPESGVYYPTTRNVRNEAGERVPVKGFRVFPENWADSMYWAADALSNLVLYSDLTEERDIADVEIAKLQGRAAAAVLRCVRAVANGGRRSGKRRGCRAGRD